LKFIKAKNEKNRFGFSQGAITRWGTTHKQLWKLSECKAAIFAVLADPNAQDYVSDELREIIYTMEFWNEINFLIELLEPIVRSIVMLEGNDSICNVFKIWSELEEIYHPDNSNFRLSEHLRLFISDKLNRKFDLINHNIYLFIRSEPTRETDRS